jgi:hypothetical protein
MMTAHVERFVRRTTLHEDEYRKNFRQIDREVIEVVKSEEAKKVTRQMGTLYLTLIDAPSRYWEREGVLRFCGNEGEGKPCTAWQQLVNLLDCGNTTAKKALDWMHRQGVIGYYAGKNGAGIRIFLNRATSSIGKRERQKNLRLLPTPATEVRTPGTGATFKDSFLENREIDKEFRAPKNGAAESETDRELSDQDPNPSHLSLFATQVTEPEVERTHPVSAISDAAVVEQIKREVITQMRSAAAQEHERTREWFISHAMPKAIRVAQHSAYAVLRSYGLLSDPRSGGRERQRTDGRGVGKHISTETASQPLTDEEITELAESCVALLVRQGQTIDRTLFEMSVEAGGFLLPEDAPKIRTKAESLTLAGEFTQNSRRENNGL